MVMPPPPSRRKRTKVEEEEDESSNPEEGDDGSENGDVEDPEEGRITTTADTGPVIRRVRGRRLDETEKMEKEATRKNNIQSSDDSDDDYEPERVSQYPSSSSRKSGRRLMTSSRTVSDSCFLCGSKACCKNFSIPRLHRQQVKAFKDMVKESMGNSLSSYLSSSCSDDTCKICKEVVQQVWDLQQEILLIKDEMKNLITRTIGKRGNKGITRRRRVQCVENVHFDKDDTGGSNNPDPGLSVKLEPVFVIEEERNGYEGFNEDSSSFVIEGEEETAKRSARPNRKDNMDAEIENDPDFVINEISDDEQEQGSSDLRHLCSTCDKRFFTLTELNSHSIAVHGGGEKVTILKSTRGKDMAGAGGYLYHFHTEGAGKRIWRCSRRKEDHCLARIHTTETEYSGETVVLNHMGTHIHPITWDGASQRSDAMEGRRKRKRGQTGIGREVIMEDKGEKERAESGRGDEKGEMVGVGEEETGSHQILLSLINNTT